MDAVLTLANCSGFYGDRAGALSEVLAGGPVDVVTGDYLAELTMLILFRARAKDPARGYATTFLRQLEPVLGTIAAGDIGTHFPPSDLQWRGAESGQFLRHAVGLVEAKGGKVTFVDLTLMCEAPKIGPHRAAMTARIAELTGLTADRVSVKATTTERLGFTGRGEGIAAQAIVTVRLPGFHP